LNDETVSGIKHKTLPIMGIQYHSEASPGPYDNEYVFDEFINLINSKKDNN
jgi:carbamoyl-phosphate synthase small subunit